MHVGDKNNMQKRIRQVQDRHQEYRRNQHKANSQLDSTALVYTVELMSPILKINQTFLYQHVVRFHHLFSDVWLRLKEKCIFLQNFQITAM